MVLAPVGRRAFLALALPLVFAASASAQPRSSIAGRVTDSVTGRPIKEATVLLFPSTDYFFPLTAVTDGRGRYRFDRLPAGGHLVAAATSAGYLGELSDGRLCFRGLTFSDRFGFRCDGFVNDPPFTTVSPGETVEVPFALDRGGVIAGRVTAAADGVPVAARVVVTSRLGELLAEALAGSDGRYRAGPLPAGAYRVLTETGELANEVWEGVHCDGRGSLYNFCDPRRGTPVPVGLRAVSDGIDFQLERLGTIAGRVVEAGSGEPLAGVRVFVQRDDLAGGFGLIGADGRYRVGGLLAGNYRVYAFEAPEHVDEIFDDVSCAALLCDPAAGTPVAVAIDQTVEEIDFALDRGAVISGSVASAESGEGLAGIGVRVRALDGGFERAAGTDAAGGFRVAGLPGGAYRIQTLFAAGNAGLADEAYDGVACGLDLGCAVEATPVTVALGEERPGIDFTLEPLGAISGRIVDQTTGAAIAGLPLIVHDPRGGIAFAQTDSAGSYLGESLPRGTYTVETEGWPEPLEFVDRMYDGIPCFLGRCDPAGGTPVEVFSGTTTGGIDLALPPGAAIVGRVTREDDGAPALFTRVSAVDALGRFAAADQVDADGHYRLRGLPDGDYHLTTLDFDLIDEVHDGIQCIHGTGLGCDPLEGTAVHTEAGAPPPAVDFALAAGFRPGTPCRQSPNRLCLDGGRFEIGVKRFTTDLGGLGRARPISDSVGAFTFFADDNVEAVVRLVDACAGFDRFWAFAASLSSLDVEAGVRDTVTGEARFYTGLDFEPALDADAFATCGAAAAPSVYPIASVGAPGVGLEGGPGTGGADAGWGAPATAGSAGGCVPGPTTLCLLGGRFAVEADWDDGAGGSGGAGAVSLGDRSGYLWFRRPESPEVVVKAIDACALEPPSFWIFASGLTTSEVFLTVTDTTSLEQRTYFNPLGQAFLPVRDASFGSCP